ncbi:MAG: hypothetical protein HYR85_03515 [Planctomycetes bacterium]|nr:hypothetical protein [Planctomycetota bacterium]MBI3845909.1 hypothetical protein [Planctomycetota bacterium]
MLRRLAAGWAVALCAASALAQPDADEGKKAVSIQLLADVTSVVPGVEFNVAVRFTIAKGWHIYWENPGDSGLPTTVSVKAPDGFEVGAVRFPGPTRIAGDDDMVTFGYEEAAALFVRIVAPKSMAIGGHVRLAATAKWLACKQSCVLGEAATTLEIPVAESSKPANADVLEPFRRHLPRPWSDLSGVQVDWSFNTPDAKCVTFRGRRLDSLEFFPDRATYATLSGRGVHNFPRTKRGPTEFATYEFQFDGRDKPSALGGVLELNQNGERTYYDVRFDWPK